MNVAISRIHFPINSLGPGKRVGVWFQGCSIRCKGCISMDTWDSSKNHVEIQQVLELLSNWLKEADGLTISGGEPFDQFEQLKLILQEAKKHKNIDTLVFTGNIYEHITNELNQLDGLIDTIITDPLDITVSQTLPLRGSDNQRLIALTSLGKVIKSKIENPPNKISKFLDLSYIQNDAYISGIPKRADIIQVVEDLKSQGTSSTTFEDVRIRRKQSS